MFQLAVEVSLEMWTVNGLVVFLRNLGKWNVYIAKFWGVFYGIRLTRDRGFSKVELHVDSSVV
jgi:hypothetical protein